MSSDTLRPGLKVPSNVKTWWYGPSWWDAPTDGLPLIHDQDMIPETDGQRKYKLMTWILVGLTSACVVLEVDFGKDEHCFSPLRRAYERAKATILAPTNPVESREGAESLINPATRHQTK